MLIKQTAKQGYTYHEHIIFVINSIDSKCIEEQLKNSVGRKS